MTKYLILFDSNTNGDVLRRTPNNLILRASTQTKNGRWLPILKGIRCKNLRYLCGLNVMFTMHEHVPHLRDNPKGCVEYIMKQIHGAHQRMWIN